MAQLPSPSVRLRTTSDHSGHPIGLVIATGTSVDEVFRSLRTAAGQQARELIDDNALAFVGGRGFEVVDVRLTAGADGAEPWCAVGTLCQIPDRNYWDQ